MINWNGRTWWHVDGCQTYAARPFSYAARRMVGMVADRSTLVDVYEDVMARGRAVIERCLAAMPAKGSAEWNKLNDDDPEVLRPEQQMVDGVEFEIGPDGKTKIAKLPMPTKERNLKVWCEGQYWTARLRLFMGDFELSRKSRAYPGMTIAIHVVPRDWTPKNVVVIGEAKGFEAAP